MKKALIVAALFATAAISAADQVIDLNNPDVWMPGKFVKNQDGTLVIKSSNSMQTKNLYPIDSKHTYNFSGTVRKAANAVTPATYFGFLFFDKDKKYIAPVMAHTDKKSVTELAEPAKKGAVTIKIKANKLWVAKNYYHAGFNVQDGKLSRDNSPGYITKVANDGANMIVTFKRPIQKDYPAGTKVRIQMAGGYYYTNYFSKTSDQWKNFGSNIKAAQFWPEAAYLRPLILANWMIPAKTDKTKIGSEYKNLKLIIKEIK